MEPIKILGVEMSQNVALIHAVSKKTVDDEPEAIITIKVRVSASRATKAYARDIALQYLDLE